MDKEESKYWKRFVRSNEFCKELGKGIQRELFSIYKCATRIFDETNYVGRYTEDEVKELKRLHAIHGSDWVTIGQLMDRSRMSVNRKISKLPPTCKDDKQEQKDRKWTDDEVKQLKEAVHLVTNTTDGQPVFHGIDWQGVAQMVKTRGAEMCRKKWLNGLCWSMAENKTESKWTKNHELKLIT
ncbi:cyclin-D-binding Myb-like transcription factor 1, partial [Oculina patagonica]